MTASTAYAARISPGRRRATLIAVTTAMFLASLDGTVVATAMPTVIGDLHAVLPAVVAELRRRKAGAEVSATTAPGHLQD